MAASMRSFTRPIRAALQLVLALCILHPGTASAATKPTLGVSLAPSSATAGSANTLTFTFTSVSAGNGTVSIAVPPSASKAPWSAPQVSNSTLPGYVAVQAGTCNSAGPVSISGTTILVDFKCAQGKTFKVVYGAGAAKANAAQLAGTYLFATQVNAGAGSLPVLVPPLVTVNPGPAASLTLGGLTDAVAGTSQAGTVTAFDAYGNVATGYAGTLHFTTTDTKTTSPADTAAGGGRASFNIALKLAGSDSVTATDTANSALKATATVTITAAGINSLTVAYSPTLVNYPTPSLPAFPGDGGAFTSCGATPFDLYGNVATFSGKLAWTSTDPYANLPGCALTSGCGTPVPVQIYTFCRFGTQGPQTVTVTDPVTGIFGQTTITVIGPIAQPDKVSVVDPTHNASSLYTVNALANDDQTSGLTGNILLGVFKNTISRVTQQPVYTDEGGVRHQVGVMTPTTEGSMLAWELNPPAELMPPVPGLVYDTCPPALTATVCHIAAPITAKYTITDGVNESEPGTITIQMDTPDTPQVEPSAITAIFSGGVPTSTGSTPVTVSLPGQGSTQIPVLAQATDVQTTPTGLASTYQVSMKFNSPVIQSGACDPKGCPTAVTLSGTAVLPDTFMASASGSSLSAALQPFLLFQPLNDLWQVGPYDRLSDLIDRGTGFLPVLINAGFGDPNHAYVPPGYAGLFGFMTISCQNATVDVNCPMPTLTFGSPGGHALVDAIAGLTFTTTPQGCAEAEVTGSVGQPVGIQLDLDFATADVGGTIHVTIWRGHDQGSCTTDPNSSLRLWSLDGTQSLETQFDFPVDHVGSYVKNWTPTWAGPYIITATYSGDFSNTTNSTHFYLFKVQ